jgi:Erythromycin esterase
MSASSSGNGTPATAVSSASLWPETERRSHYFRARLADQFDAVIHLDETRAVEPLERTARWEEGEMPETYPFAI